MSNRFHNRAFSFVELLVTLAVVAALAAILFPVIASGRTSRNQGCLSNHHSLVQAVSMYVQDFGEGDLTSKLQLDPYIGRDLKSCPNAFTPAFKHLEAKPTSADDQPRDDGDDHGKYRNSDDGDQNGAGPQHGAGGSTTAAGNMTYHSGGIMGTTATAAIFWGKSWATTSFVADKVTGLDLWYAGFGNSHYAATSNEYTGTDLVTKASGSVTSNVTYMGHYIDTTAAATGSPTTTAIQAEVCKVIPAAKLVVNGYYAVYTDTPRGTNGFCAWHSWGTCSGIPVQFAFFFTMDTDSGCSPNDTSKLHTAGLAALANVSAHELSEARTDPRGAGWFDAAGSENGDKCAWTFGAPLVSLSNGSQWKLQGEWSNKAFTAGTGYANLSGQKGCLSGL